MERPKKFNKSTSSLLYFLIKLIGETFFSFLLILGFIKGEFSIVILKELFIYNLELKMRIKY